MSHGDRYTRRWALTYTAPPPSIGWGPGEGFLTLMQIDDLALLDVVPRVRPSEIGDAVWTLFEEWFERDLDVVLDVLDSRCMPPGLRAWLEDRNVTIVPRGSSRDWANGAEAAHAHAMAIDLLTFAEQRYDANLLRDGEELYSNILYAVIDPARLGPTHQALCVEGRPLTS